MNHLFRLCIRHLFSSTLALFVESLEPLSESCREQLIRVENVPNTFYQNLSSRTVPVHSLDSLYRLLVPCRQNNETNGCPPLFNPNISRAFRSFIYNFLSMVLAVFLLYYFFYTFILGDIICCNTSLTHFSFVSNIIDKVHIEAVLRFTNTWLCHYFSLFIICNKWGRSHHGFCLLNPYYFSIIFTFVTLFF